MSNPKGWSNSSMVVPLPSTLSALGSIPITPKEQHAINRYPLFGAVVMGGLGECASFYPNLYLLYVSNWTPCAEFFWNQSQANMPLVLREKMKGPSCWSLVFAGLSSLLLPWGRLLWKLCIFKGHWKAATSGSQELLLIAGSVVLLHCLQTGGSCLERALARLLQASPLF